MIPLQLLCNEWKLPGLGRRPSLLSQRGGLSQWAGCASQREGGGSVEKGQFWWPGLEDKARTLPMWVQHSLQDTKRQRQDLFLIPAKKEKLCCARIEQGKRTNLFLSAFMGKKIDVYYFYLVSFVFFVFFLENLNIRITNCIKINSTNLHFKCMRALYCYVSSYWFPRILKPGLHGSARHACCSEVYMSRCRRSVG